MKKYIFKSYNEIFPQLFEAEKARLLETLAVSAKTEHIGSTAVSNLGGKGIIDIYVIVDKENIQEASNDVQKGGYEFREKASTPDRLFHRIDLPDPVKGTRRYHLQVSYPENRDVTQAIIFRDYLRNHIDAI